MSCNRNQVLVGIAKILVDCIDPSVPWMKDFLTQLCDEDGITADEKSSLQDLLTDIAIQDVMKQAIELAGNKDGGFKIIERVLVTDEDFALGLSEEATKVSELLLDNWNDETSACLILIWDQLRQNKNHATSIASEIWTESPAISQGDWPRNFICFCLEYAERDKVERFVTSFSIDTNLNCEQPNLIAIKDCFLEIFSRCLDSKMMIKLIVKLRGEEALTKEEKKSLIYTVKNDDTKDAVLAMIDLVDKTDHGFQYFADIFQDNENMFTEEVAEIVVHMATHGLASRQMKLILLWAELMNHFEIIRRWIVELWPDLPGLVDTNWPLHFIAFCITGQCEDVEKIGMLVNEISEMAKNQQVSEFSSDHTENPETFPKAEDSVGEDASFVIVSEDECTGRDDGEEITQHEDELLTDNGSWHSSAYTDDPNSFLDANPAKEPGNQIAEADRRDDGDKTPGNTGKQVEETPEILRNQIAEADRRNDGDKTPGHTEKQIEETPKPELNEVVENQSVEADMHNSGDEIPIGTEKQMEEAENVSGQVDRSNIGDDIPANKERQVDKTAKPNLEEITETPSSQDDSHKNSDEIPANTEKLMEKTPKSNSEETENPIGREDSGDETPSNVGKQTEETIKPNCEEITGDETPDMEDSTDEESDDSNDHSHIELATEIGIEYSTSLDDFVGICENYVPAIVEECIDGKEKPHVNVQNDVLLTQSEEDFNTNMNGQPVNVEFRVFVKEAKWVSEGWQPHLLLHGMKPKRMHFHRSGEFYYCQIPVQSDVQDFYYIYRLHKRERTGNGYHYKEEFLPNNCPERYFLFAKGVKQTTLDIATFNWEETDSGWNSLMRKRFWRFLPNMNNCEKTKHHAYQEIQDWFVVAYLGWQFHTSESEPYVERLTTKEIEKITKNWLQSLMKSRERSMVVACCIFVVVAIGTRKRSVGSKDLLKSLLLGLQTHDIDGVTLQTLIKELIFIIGKAELTGCLEGFLKTFVNNEDVSIILILPLYQCVLWGGYVYLTRLEIYTPNLLKERALLHGQIDWDEFRESILATKNKHDDLFSLWGKILKLSHTHPHVVDTYQYFLPLGILIKLMGKKEIFTKFHIDSIFSQILPVFETDDKQNLKRIISEVTPYLFERFNSHIQALGVADDIQRELSEKKVKYLLESIVREVKWYGTKAKDLINFRQECFNWLLSMASYCFRWLHALNYDYYKLNQLHNEIVQSAKRFIRNDFIYSKETDVKQLEFYDTQIGQEWYDDHFQSAWRDEISWEIGTCIDKRWTGVDNEDYLGFYMKMAQKRFHNIVSSILESNASDRVLKAVKAMGDTAGSKLPTLLVHFCKRGIFNPVAGAVEKTLEKYWDEDPTMRSLKFLAESEMAPILYQAFGQENLSTLNKSAASTNLQRLHDETYSIFEKLKHKKLKLKEMRFILQNKARITELLSSIEKLKREAVADQAPLTLEIKLLMESSERINTSYHERCAAVSSFVEFCKSLQKGKIKVDCGDLTGLTREDENISLEEAEQITVEDPAMKEMKLILTIQKSKMFVRVRRQIAKEYYTNAPKTSPGEKVLIEWQKALSFIWKDVARRLNDLMAKLQNGSLGNKDISCEFKDFKENPQQLVGELELLTAFYKCSNVSECDEVTRTPNELAAAISHVFTRERQKKVIKWMVEFKTKHQISGDFGILEGENLLQRNFDELSKLEIISRISQRELKILEDFSAQQDLIEWLQSYPNGKEGLEALCLVAGEASRYNVPLADRWSMLKQSIMAFGDLLFGLSAISSIDNLISRCLLVLQNVNDGDEIETMTKWFDTGKNLTWYKENAGKHGSEQLSALEFAKRANKAGTYVVGKPSEASVPTLVESIHMVFDQTENNDADTEPEDKEIPLEKLHDYESILTLITNDGEESAGIILQYIETLTAIERLAKAYVNLINAGFILLSRWKMKISCSWATGDDVTSERILTTWMTFNDGAGNLGRQASITEINQLSDEMNKALFKWESHVSDMRLKHYHLNEYDIQQIRYLCENLGKTHQHTFNDQVYLLLSNAPRQSLITHIRDSLNEALTIAMDEGIVFESPQEDQSLSQDEIENRKKQQAVRYLVMSERISEKLAKAAVQASGHDNLTDCVNWVVLNEYEEEEVENQCREFNKTIEFVHGERGAQEDATILRDSSVTTVAGMIAHLQSRANQVDITSAVKTIITGYLTGTTGAALKDHLSVHHLGVFLSILRRKLGEITTPRFLGYPFYRGAPNLIITEKEAVIPTALSLYCSETDSLLPNSNEVLLCSENTTVDEVERFLLRAMCRCSDKQKNCQSEEITGKMLDLVRHLTKNERVPNELAKAAVQANGYTDVSNCIKWAKLNEKEENEVKALSDDFDRTVGAGPIFCIISLENLQFNVWKALDIKYEILANSSHNSYVNNRYQLVLITTSGNHHAALPFIKYQLADSPIVNLEAIDSFVKREMNRDGISNLPFAKVITSYKAGMGKSLHVERICEKLPRNCKRTTVRLLDSTISMEAVIQRLTRDQATEDPKLIHIDISQAVENDLEKFVFDLLILGLIKDKAGHVWRRRKNHSYVIEVTTSGGNMKELSHTLDLLPTLTAISPEEVLKRLKGGTSKPDELSIDSKEHRSQAFQRTVHYLKLNKNNRNMSKFTYHKKLDAINEKESLQILLTFCGIENPTWAQLKHFVSFLNVLLLNCEKSSFFKANVDDLEGLKELSVKFMITMARDFATPSLVIADESSKLTRSEAEGTSTITIVNYQIRRKWEEQDHSYIFFNDDGHTMTFINVNIDELGNLLDKDGNVLENGIANRRLIRALKHQKFKFGFQFQKLNRTEKLQCLRNIMGISKVVDPDESYELTTDNVLKMIAIYLRLRHTPTPVAFR